MHLVLPEESLNSILDSLLGSLFYFGCLWEHIFMLLARVCLLKAPQSTTCSDWSALTGLSRYRPLFWHHLLLVTLQPWLSEERGIKSLPLKPIKDKTYSISRNNNIHIYDDILMSYIDLLSILMSNICMGHGWHLLSVNTTLVNQTFSWENKKKSISLKWV